MKNITQQQEQEEFNDLRLSTNISKVYTLVEQNFEENKSINDDTTLSNLSNKIIILNYLEKRQKKLDEQVTQYPDGAKGLSDESILLWFKENINSHNYYGWKYLSLMNELCCNKLKQNISNILEKVNFNNL